MKTWFLDFWREREEVLKRTNQLRLRPPQLKRLLGDSSLRTELENGRLASLLPPVGTEVFRSFTPASLQDITGRHEAKETERQERTNKDLRNDTSAVRWGRLGIELPDPWSWCGLFESLRRTRVFRDPQDPLSSSDEFLKDLDSPQRMNLCQLLEPNRTSLTSEVQQENRQTDPDPDPDPDPILDMLNSPHNTEPCC
ncbi:unnamed protein product, partial [Pleuronectes platessa]